VSDDGGGAADGGAANGGGGAADGGAPDGGGATDGGVSVDDGGGAKDGGGAVDDGGGATDGGTTDGGGAADGGGGAADGGAADGGAADGGGGVRAGPAGRCWHGDGNLLDLADGDGVPIFREPLGGTRRHFLVYTTPPATVTEEVLADVPVESAWLADAIKELDGRSYIGILDRTSVAFTLGCAVQQAIRVHMRTLIRPPTNPRTKRISLNAAIAAVGLKNCHKMVNWDGVEVSKLAPAFVSDSKNVAIITEWKTRSEASSMRLRRGRGRDGQPVVPAPRPSELPLDW